MSEQEKPIGPFPLLHTDIISRIPKETKGVYILITVHEGDPYVRFIGRSDNDLAQDLMGFLNEYDQYAFQVCEDDISSFLSECRAFHDYGGLKMLANAIHPDPPYVNLFCPVCGYGVTEQQHGQG